MLNKKQEAGDKPTSCGTHERIRTSCLLLRRESLCPIELRGHKKTCSSRLARTTAGMLATYKLIYPMLKTNESILI